jgi:hypothetical protein
MSRCPTLTGSVQGRIGKTKGHCFGGVFLFSAIRILVVPYIVMITEIYGEKGGIYVRNQRNAQRTEAILQSQRRKMMKNNEMIYGTEFTVKVNSGDVYINGKFYRQLAWTPNQIALVIEDYLNGVPADDGNDID